MKKERSLRFRLTVWYASILAAALGLFSGLLWFSLRQSLLNELDASLADRAARFQTYVITEAAEVPAAQLRDELEEFCQALPPSDELELLGDNGFQFRHRQRTGSGSTEATRTLVRRFAAGGNRFTLQIRSSLQAIDHTLRLLEFLLLSLAPLAVAIACFGGAWLSRRALGPIDEITTAARTIGIDNLSLRLRVPQTGDELQRLTEVWNLMLGRLEEAVQTLSQFAADASHELRTPLSVIRTGAEVALRRARSPESYRESLREIAEEAGRMTQLVEDLMLIARSDAQTSEMPRQPLDLVDLLEDVAAELRSIAGVKQIRIRIHAPDRAAVISGNRTALRRLFLVLLDNAIKYSYPGSEVIAAISTADRQATVTVKDFGIGISPEDRPHIFKRFYQADRARGDAGFGLGLSLAESIAGAHGASIEVSSAEGPGSTFRVVFRLAETAFTALAESRRERVSEWGGQ
jgi:two-component system, OmpR family, heavy metal sensor histidine kinase CusS